MSSRKRNRKRWAKIVGQFRQSGLSAPKFADHLGLSLSSLRYWIQRIPEEPSLEFLPVNCPKPLQSELGPVTLELPGGRLLHFSDRVCPQALALFISQLS